MQFEPRHVEHGVGGMHELLEGVGDTLDDTRMLVAERGTHLPRLKIQILLAIDIGDYHTRGFGQDRPVLQAAHVTLLLGWKHPGADDLASLGTVHLGFSAGRKALGSVCQMRKKMRLKRARSSSSRISRDRPRLTTK